MHDNLYDPGHAAIVVGDGGKMPGEPLLRRLLQTLFKHRLVVAAILLMVILVGGASIAWFWMHRMPNTHKQVVATSPKSKNSQNPSANTGTGATAPPADKPPAATPPAPSTPSQSQKSTPPSSSGGGSTGGGSSGGTSGGGSSGGGTSGPPASTKNCFANPHGCGYADTTNTGVPAGTTLTASGGLNITTAGTVIDSKDITGTVVIAANNVTIKNSRVHGAILVHDDGAIIKDTEVTSPSGSTTDIAIDDSGCTSTLTRVYLHDTTNGWQTCGGLIVDSFIHLTAVPGGHYDGVQNGGGSHPQLTIRHNTIFNDNSDTGCVSLFQDFGSQNNDTVDNNFLAGGSYTIYGGGGGKGDSNIVITNNRFSRHYYPTSGSAGWLGYFDDEIASNVWSGNYWDDTLATVTD